MVVRTMLIICINVTVSLSHHHTVILKCKRYFREVLCIPHRLNIVYQVYGIPYGLEARNSRYQLMMRKAWAYEDIYSLCDNDRAKYVVILVVGLVYAILFYS